MELGLNIVSRDIATRLAKKIDGMTNVKAAETITQSSGKDLGEKAAQSAGPELNLLAQFKKVSTEPNISPAIASQYPLTVQNQAHIRELLNAGTGANFQHVLQEIQSQTESNSGIHQIAKNLEQLNAAAPDAELFNVIWKTPLFQTHSFEDLVNLSPADTALATAKIAGQAVHETGLDAAKYGNEFGNGLKTLETLKAVNRFIRNSPGLPQEAIRHLDTANAQAEAIPVKRGLFGGPKDQGVIDKAKAYNQGFDLVNTVNMPTLQENPVLPDVFAKNQAQKKATLLDQLLNLKVALKGDWKVFSSEDWIRINSASQTDIQTVRSGVFHPKTTTTGAGQAQEVITSPVDLQIPGVEARAPMVSPDFIKQHPGDYIVSSKGQIHMANSANPADWFAIVERDVKGLSRTLGQG